MTPSMSLIWKAALALVVVYVLVVVAMYVAQRRFVYAPDPTRVAPASIGITNVREITLPTPDGETLVAWRADARGTNPTILYFHGNAGNLASRRERIEAYSREGLGALMLAYRSYAGSTGTPDEETIAADARLAYQHLIDEGVPAGRIVAYGESLGTGVATRLASEQPVGALILDAPFTALVDVAAREQPALPVRYLLTERFETVKRLPNVHVPVLILHGARDPLVPIDMGREVFKLANEPKEIVEFPAGAHSDLYDHGAMNAIRSFLSRHVPGARTVSSD
ncbi:MAG: alpha/beta hydrolase [Rhizobiales bacterium]|nr:alpha/beta hydrolase [Hyphomicrobiales bacterium]